MLSKEIVQDNRRENALYRGLCLGGRLGSKIGKDFIELAKAIPWKNHMLQTLIASGIAIAAYKHQKIEALNVSISPSQSEPSAPVEVPVSPEKAAITQPLSHRVNRGDTLYSIARKYGTSVEAILEANPWIKNRNLIHAGQELTIPGGVSVEAPSYKTILGSPPTYKMKEQDISFLNWLNSTHLNWRDWNGYKQRIYIPDWVYQYAKTAEVASGGRCSWTQLVGIGLTETGYFKGSQWDPETLSYAGARGLMQFMPGTFKVHAPYEGANPEDPKDNMVAACNKIVYQRLAEETTLEGWVANFLGDGPTKQKWNEHPSQANNSKLLADTLKECEAKFEGMYETTVNE